MRSMTCTVRGEKAVCVCSGGLDSTVAATIAAREGYELHILHASYGQIAEEREIEAVKRISEELGAKELVFVDLGFLGAFGGSALTDRSIEIPIDERVELDGTSTPDTWVPCRNLVLLAVASAYAESIGASTVFVGFNAEEAQSYPDNTPTLLERFNDVLEHAVASFTDPITVRAPLIGYFKREIVRKGVEVGAPLGLTWSCYLSGNLHCGRCEACQHRKRGFREAEVEDVTIYERK